MADLVIDLSHWNIVDDWDEVVRSGIMAVIHKATEGASYVDDTYHQRAKEARSAGLLWGAYHFLRPGDMGGQAAHFVDTVGEIDIYAADHEDSGVSLEDLKDFLDALDGLTGRKAVVYSGHVIKEQVGTGSDPFLSDHPLWLAQYSSNPSWPSKIWPTYWLWQHTDVGDCPGVDGNVDLNDYQGSREELFAEWTGERPPVEPLSEVEVRVIAGNVKVTIVK